MSKNFNTPRAVLSPEEEEFEKLFSDPGAPQPAMMVSRGEMVTGRIVSMNGESTFVALGGKAEGVIDTRELEGMNLKVGDELTAMVVSTQGEVRLSKGLGHAAIDSALLQDAFDAGIPVEGKITGRNKGGFDVEVGGARGFMPVSHADVEPVTDPDAWVGQTHRFKIIEFAEGGKRLVVSRAQLLRDERERKAKELWAELAVDQVRQGTVRSVQDYGAFVDLGGVDGLVHLSEMQWARFSHPREIVTPGQSVTVRVTELDPAKKRIGLSMKNADSDPWKQLGVGIKVGDHVEGEVTRLERYGAFVEILPGVEGLIHVSELTFLRRINHPQELLTVGDKVKVTILDIDHMTKRVALSMKKMEGDPWEEVAHRFPVGSTVEGFVERTAPFGVFVQVAPGVTALLPGSETNQPRGVDLSRAFKPGQPIVATVLSVEPQDRRMSISLKAAATAAEAANVSEYQQKGKAKAPGFGTFADLLKDRKV